MSRQVLSLAFRPRKLSRVIGQEKLLKKIRGHFQQGRVPQAWMFVGQTGGGKTTLARILARLIQCRHWGKGEIDVCDDCFKKRWTEYDNTVIQANLIRGVDKMEQAIHAANYEPRPGSRARVYILDELHRASEPAQEVLLTPMEFCPPTTYWIVCTTETDKILPTIQSRCIKYTVPGLDEKGVQLLVRRGLKKIGSELDPETLVDQLLEAQVTSPRSVLGAVEKYTAGSSPEEAVMQVSTEVDTLAICRSVVGGVWEKVARQLLEMKPEDVDSVRSAMIGYLRTMLFSETEFTDRTALVAEAILELQEKGRTVASLGAVLYGACKEFKKRRG